VSSFEFRGRKYVVEMIDPVITRNKAGGLNIPSGNYGTYSGGQRVETKRVIKWVGAKYVPPSWGIYFEVPYHKDKKRVLWGLYCPATFRVTGYLYDVTFTTGVKDAPRLRPFDVPNSRVVVNSLTAKSQAGKDTEPVTREMLGRIPVALLLEHALKASSFIGRYTDEPSPIPNFEIVKIGHEHLKIKEVDNFLGRKRRGQPKADDTALSDKSVKEYARHWHACPANYPGGKDAYVANNMVMAIGVPLYNVSTRNRQLRRARDLGLIPDVPRKHKYKRKSGKRGKK